MQIDPGQLQVVVNTADGAHLKLDPGRQVVARVVEVTSANTARISLAGQTLDVTTTTPVRPGDEIRLAVVQADATGVRLELLPNDARMRAGTMPANTTLPASVIPATSIPSASGNVAATLMPSTVPLGSVITELAKAGVPISPNLLQTVQQIAGQVSPGNEQGFAARAVSMLAGRDLVLSPSAGGRVLAALETAGTIGPALQSLANRSPVIAAAMPTGAPNAAALRSVLAPNLQPAEFAVARIVQAVTTQAAVTVQNPVAAASPAAASNPSIASNLTASVSGAQTAAQSSTTARAPNISAAMPASTAHAETAARSVPVAQPGTTNSMGALRTYLASQLAASETSLTSNVTQLVGRDVASAQTMQATQTGQVSLASLAVRSSVIGSSAFGTSSAQMQGALLQTPNPFAATERVASEIARLIPNTVAAANATASNAGNIPLPLVANQAVKVAALAAASTGVTTALPEALGARAAQAVVQLANLAAQITQTTGPLLGAAQSAENDLAARQNTAVIAQQRGSDGSTLPANATIAGRSAGGDAAPLLQAIQTFMASPKAAGDTAQLQQALNQAPPATLAQALRSIPQAQALQIAGQLLEQINSGLMHRGGADIAAVRGNVAEILDQLGRALAPQASPADELAVLRRALEQVAQGDSRSAVTQDAQRLLAAMDGQQLISRQMSGADPGYVYFQVPLPDGRGAEIMVRREAGRREISFDEFNIAFLLDTQNLGTLMLQLDAHPGAITADIYTDRPEFVDFLEASSKALMEPLARESKRPVVINTGVFDTAPPESLIDTQIGVRTAGENEYYA